MLMILALPPPFNGQSIVNAKLLEFTRAAIAPTECVDIAPSSTGGLVYHLSRMRRVARASRHALQTAQPILFFSSEAGFGVVYLFVLVLIARARNKTIFLHHHVISYIEKYSLLHSLLIRFAGVGAHHVLLSPKMARKFLERFGNEYKCSIVRNAIFIDPHLRTVGAPRRADAYLAADVVIGFIGRLEEQKGFGEFLQICRSLAAEPRARFIVAGDYRATHYNREIADVREILQDRISFRGFVNGDDKVRFYQDVDVLIFPSKYKNEASPMVCYESLAMGVPVLSSDIGAVSDIVDESCGQIFPIGADMVEAMTATLHGYLAREELLRAQQDGAARRFRWLEQEAERELAVLLRSFAARGDAEAVQQPT